MSIYVSNVWQSAFDAEVKRAYGNVSSLQGTVYTKTGVVGKEIYFRKKGKGVATSHVAFADITPMDTNFTQVKCALDGWDAYDYVDEVTMSAINFSEIKEIAEVAGDALGLRKDQIIIDAMTNGYDSTNHKVGTTGTALSINTLLAGKKLLDEAGVPTEDRYFIHSATQLEDLLKTTQVTSADYNSVRALVNGEIGSFLGMKFICIATRSEGGLPLENSNADVLGFIYHKRAVGFGLGKDIATKMEYVPQKLSYMVGGSFYAGAVVIDQEGVVGVLSAK